MPWYGWLPWILLILTVAGVIIYFLARKKPQTPEELQRKLTEMEQRLVESLKNLDAERMAKKDAEEEKAQKELAYLELLHKERLDSLKKEERKTYDETKTDPQSGVDYINGLLDSGSKPGKS